MSKCINKKKKVIYAFGTKLGHKFILNSYCPNLGGAITSSLIIYSMNNHGGYIEMAKIPMRPKIGTHDV
jgi:hypothetical protein